MALGNSSECALNRRFIFWRSRGECPWDLYTYLGRCSGHENLTNCSRKWASDAYVRIINQYEKGRIDFRLLCFRPGDFLSDSDMIILKHHMIPQIDPDIITPKNLTIPRICTVKEQLQFSKLCLFPSATLKYLPFSTRWEWKYCLVYKITALRRKSSRLTRSYWKSACFELPIPYSQPSGHMALPWGVPRIVVLVW